MGGFGVPGYTATWYPSRPVQGQDADFSLVRQNLSLGLPIWKDSCGRLLLTTTVRHSLYVTDAVLPDTQRPFPSELWYVNMGLNYMRRFENGWSMGLMGTFGSASDRPFHSIDELALGVTGFVQIPAWNERDAWQLSVMYSTAGNLNFPIPGAAYVWNPSDNLRVNIGLPFIVFIRPMEDLTFNLFYVPLTNINARVTYRLAEKLSVYAGYEFLNEAYFLADRLERRDRFMGFEQRVLGGIRWDLWRYAALDMNAGYVFGRQFGEGLNQGDNLFNQVDIEPGAFLGASLRIRY